MLMLAYATAFLNLLYLLLVSFGWVISEGQSSIPMRKFLVLLIPYIVGTWFAIAFILEHR